MNSSPEVHSHNHLRYFPNGLNTPDRVNNNERIIVKQPQTGTWQVINIYKPGRLGEVTVKRFIGEDTISGIASKW